MRYMKQYAKLKVTVLVFTLAPDGKEPYLAQPVRQAICRFSSMRKTHTHTKKKQHCASGDREA